MTTRFPLALLPSAPLITPGNEANASSPASPSAGPVSRRVTFWGWDSVGQWSLYWSLRHPSSDNSLTSAHKRTQRAPSAVQRESRSSQSPRPQTWQRLPATVARICRRSCNWSGDSININGSVLLPVWLLTLSFACGRSCPCA